MVTVCCEIYVGTYPLAGSHPCSSLFRSWIGTVPGTVSIPHGAAAPTSVAPACAFSIRYDMFWVLCLTIHPSCTYLKNRTK